MLGVDGRSADVRANRPALFLRIARFIARARGRVFHQDMTHPRGPLLSQRVLAFFLATVVYLNALWGDVPQPDEVYIRVVDVGAGECVVIRAPGANGFRYMVYDAGNFEDNGTTAINAVRDIIPRGSSIELLVVSHSDADHLAGVPAIVRDYQVKRILHPGMERETDAWRRSDAAIKAEENDGAENLDLSRVTIAPGTDYQIGRVRATFVAGFHKPPADWDVRGDSEDMNAGSIVFRIYYEGRSVLLCGDAVGRHLNSPAGTCIATEKYIVDRRWIVPVGSDVIVAPHHGANNGSSEAFIEAVAPQFVVFSAGHKHRHPTAAAAQRYLDTGIVKTRMLRTDRGDDEGAEEWNYRRVRNQRDRPGDDDVEIRISGSGGLSVKYRNP